MKVLSHKMHIITSQFENLIAYYHLKNTDKVPNDHLTPNIKKVTVPVLFENHVNALPIIKPARSALQFHFYSLVEIYMVIC